MSSPTESKFIDEKTIQSLKRIKSFRDKIKSTHPVPIESLTISKINLTKQ